MKTAIRYFTKTGNTKKLAKAVSEVTGVEALAISEELTENVERLYLGSSVYWAGTNKEIQKFINSIDVEIGEIVNFSSAAIIESTYSSVKKIADKKGIKMCDKEFHCKGAFTGMHKGRPNADDIKDIKAFVKRVENR